MGLSRMGARKDGTFTEDHVYRYVCGDDSSKNSTQNRKHNVCAQNFSGVTKRAWRKLPGTSTLWRDPTGDTVNVIRFYPSEYTYSVYYGAHRTDYYSTSSADHFGNPPNINYFWPVMTGTFPDWDANDLNRAVVECLLKLADGKAELGAALGSAKQTVSMIAGAVFTLARSLLAAKRGNWGAIPGILGGNRHGPALNPANRYLEYIYGWRPLIDDIYGGVELLKQQLDPALLIEAKRTISSSSSINRQEGEVLHEGKVSHSTTVHLYGKLSDGFIASSKRAANQAGLLNPLSIAWELVPWSFVIDWVMPVGNVLGALTATSGLDFVGGYRGRRAEGSKELLKNPRRYPESDLNRCRMTVKRFGFRREPYLSWPKPMPYVKSPFSDAHTINALALLSQLRR